MNTNTAAKSLCEHLFQLSVAEVIRRTKDWNPLRRKQIFRSEDWNFVHQTLAANCSGMMFDVCERFMPPQAAAAHTMRDGFSWRHEELLSGIV